MREPNFIIAGGVATGTSFLANSIIEHPQIYLPPEMRPECGFFYKSWEYKKGKEYYLNRWFKNVKNETAVGERSSLYLHGTFNNVAERIYKMYPQMKLIFCLRNPTERAFGNYRFTAITGYETLPFMSALGCEDERKMNARGWKSEIQLYLYRERGLYFQQLQPFYALFPAKNILCIKSEEMAKNANKTFQQVFEFLNVDKDFRPAPKENYSSPNVKSLKAQYLLRALIGKRFVNITEDFRNHQMPGLLNKLCALNINFNKVSMSKEERSYLNSFYVSHNEQLSRFLNWDLSDWK